MNNLYQNIVKSIPLVSVVLLYCLLGGIKALAQKPTINAVEKNSTSMGEVVSIKGNGFGIVPADLTVFFGAVQGVINTASDQLIEVQVPAGATYDHVSVTRAGKTGYSSDQFLLSFGGNSPFDVNNLDAIINFPSILPAERGLSDLCLCDFDGDKDLDIATANKLTNIIVLLKNTSTPGSVSFTPLNLPLPTGAFSIRIKCGDLNGDGMPDIVATGGESNKLYILQNNGAGTFPGVQTILIANTQQVRIADVDSDGKPDLIISHDKPRPLSSKNLGYLSILKNQTAGSVISFATPVIVAIPAIEENGTDALDVIDLNGDNKPEIITSRYNNNSSGLFVLQNNSSTSLSFTDATELKLSSGDPVSGFITNIRCGDLNGDSKPEIVVNGVLSSGLEVFKNNSTESAVNFAHTGTLPVDSRPWGMDFGDLDGDGKPDIVVTSVDKDKVIKNLTILNNQSSGNTISFVQSLIPTTIITRHVILGDIDRDGKTDIAFTKIDDDAKVNQKVSIIRNKSCMIPKIKPTDAAKLTVCKNVPLRLTSTISGGATYAWSADGVGFVNNASFYDVPTTLPFTNKKYVVNVTQPGTTCSITSNEVTVTVINDPAGSLPVFSPSLLDPVCVDSDLKLEVQNDPGNTYNWSGPNNYSATNTSSPAPFKFTLDYVGLYYVDVISNSGCLSQRGSILIKGINSSGFSISLDGPRVFCEGSRKLTVSPNPVGVTYQWLKGGATITGETSSTYSIPSGLANTGDYTVAVTIPNCNQPVIPAVKVLSVSKPVPDFLMPAQGCKGEAIQFTNSTTKDANAEAIIAYSWIDETGQFSTDEKPTHIFTNVQTYNVKLKAAYQDNACEVTSTAQPIIIKSAPTVKITSPDNPGLKFCPDESIKLQVLGTFDSFLWSNAETTNAIKVTTPGHYAVTVKVNSCTLNDSLTVATFHNKVTASVTPDQINEGGTAQLLATGLVDFTWTPAESLSNASLPNPEASPIVTTTYIVSGKDINKCKGSDSVTVQVKGDPIVSKLGPANFFSPNGSEPNETWVVDKIDNYPQCNVAIYDDKGIKVFEAKPYDNKWEGTFKGRKLPEGVYYYIIRCDGEENKPRSGSITLLR